MHCFCFFCSPKLEVGQKRYISTTALGVCILKCLTVTNQFQLAQSDALGPWVKNLQLPSQPILQAQQEASGSGRWNSCCVWCNRKAHAKLASHPATKKMLLCRCVQFRSITTNKIWFQKGHLPSTQQERFIDNHTNLKCVHSFKTTTGVDDDYFPDPFTLSEDWINTFYSYIIIPLPMSAVHWRHSFMKSNPIL